MPHTFNLSNKIIKNGYIGKFTGYSFADIPMLAYLATNKTPQTFEKCKKGKKK